MAEDLKDRCRRAPSIPIAEIEPGEFGHIVNLSSNNTSSDVRNEAVGDIAPCTPLLIGFQPLGSIKLGSEPRLSRNCADTSQRKIKPIATQEIANSFGGVRHDLTYGMGESLAQRLR